MRQVCMDTALSSLLDRLERQFEQGLLSELTQGQRDQIEAALCEMHDMDDLTLLYGTPLGSRYMRLRQRLVEESLQKHPSVA